MTKLLKNIKLLVNVSKPTEPLRGKDLQNLPTIENAYLLVEEDIIADFGAMSLMPEIYRTIPDPIDLTGKIVLPSWCDSHTHLVFAGSRENEFIDKIRGLTYAEIAARGGGILNSAKMINETAEEDLFIQSYKRLQEVIQLGTGAIEIKSGYGLSVEGELKMLRVIQRLKSSAKIPIKVTFLGAHTYPLAFRNNHDGYIRMIIDEMLPVIGKDKLADYIDVFCEDGFFTTGETELICKAGLQYGLIPKIHANQLSASKGVEIGVKCNALSVDHLECMDKASISVLANSKTIGTLLPSAAFFLRMPFQPARELIDANCAIALASDYNPGSSPSGNMNFIVALSCIQMKMLPEESINAATINGAFAMELQNKVGSIAVGKLANLVVTKPIPSLYYMPYAFGNNLIDQVMLAGEWVK